MKSENWGIDTINDWSNVLFDLQVTPSEFEEAKHKAGLTTWMISHPVEFLELGRGRTTDNYPDASQAYDDQANFRTDCPIAYETAKRVGFWELRNEPRSKTYPQWQKHYAEVCKLHSQGADFKKPQVQKIEYNAVSDNADTDVSDRCLNDIKSILARREK